MSQSLSRKVLHSLTNESEALQVVVHAMRQRRRGKQPARKYKDIVNPRRALEVALMDLGTTSFNPNKPLFERPRIALPPMARTNLAQPVPFDVSVQSLTMTLVKPRDPELFHRRLDNGPAMVHLVVVDDDGRKNTIGVRLNHDLDPFDRDQVLMRGRISTRRGWKAHYSDAASFLITTGSPVQIRIDPIKKRFLVEFIP